MKAAAGIKVIVVCLNVFLAFWSKNTYSSGYYDNDQIQYVSLNRFIRMVPEPDTRVHAYEAIVPSESVPEPVNVLLLTGNVID